MQCSSLPGRRLRVPFGKACPLQTTHPPQIGKVNHEMKAAYIERHGGPEVLQYGDLPDPVAGAGEVVVDIVAASVNGADWKVRVGDCRQPKFPYVLGRDFSGVDQRARRRRRGFARRRCGLRRSAKRARKGPMPRRSRSRRPSSPRSPTGCRTSMPRRWRSPG